MNLHEETKTHVEIFKNSFSVMLLFSKTYLVVRFSHGAKDS